MKLLLALAIVTVCGCISPTPPYIHLPPAKETSGVRVEATHVVRRPHRYEGVFGTVTNLTDEIVTSCRISYQAYDHESLPLTKANVTLENLVPGEFREFKALFDRATKDVRTIAPPKIRPVFADAAIR